MQMIARNTTHSVTPVSFAAFGRKLPNARRCSCMCCVRFKMCLQNWVSRVLGFNGAGDVGRVSMGVFLGRTLGP